MNRLYFVVIVCLAIASVFLIFVSMWRDANAQIAEERPVVYPIAPFNSYITGVGIVEASSENIFIGTPVPRIVDQVMVKVGSEVKKGEPLLQLENRDLEADLASRRVAYEIALAKLQKLEVLPRKEDTLIAEAAVRSAEVLVSQSRSQYEMVQGLQDTRAMSQEQMNRRRFDYEQADAKFQEAFANLEKVKAGTWRPDLQIASLEVLEAQTNIERMITDIERTIIRSPIDGKVLQIRIHKGEFPPVDTSRTPIMVVGNTDEKHLEVSINQFNAPYFNSEAPAIAFLQGNSRVQFPLEFVSLEPYLINKQNLNNDIMEKVDTRVLQVTYRFHGNDQNIFVGQQMDVFIKTDDSI